MKVFLDTSSVCDPKGCNFPCLERRQQVGRTVPTRQQRDVKSTPAGFTLYTSFAGNFSLDHAIIARQRLC